MFWGSPNLIFINIQKICSVINRLSPIDRKGLREGIKAITFIENQKQVRKESLRENEQKLIELISWIDFISLQTEFDEQLNNQAKFPRS